MLTTGGRRARVLATVVAGALLLAGSVWGSDDDFPFGPFRMYAGVNDPNGDVVSSYLQAVLPGGRTLRVDERGTGLRRAELEAQIGEFTAHPSELATIAKAHRELHPDESPYVEVQVVREDQHLHHAALASTTRTVVASWKASS